jgi:hypothetical protein
MWAAHPSRNQGFEKDRGYAMGYSGIQCPECQSNELQKKRRVGQRYQIILSDEGLRIGEYRYYKLYCRKCRYEFYCQERCLYSEQNKTILRNVVNEEAFHKASMRCPGSEYIGTTASEYTLMIAAGADHPYAFRHLSSNP